MADHQRCAAQVLHQRGRKLKVLDCQPVVQAPGAAVGRQQPPRTVVGPAVGRRGVEWVVALLGRVVTWTTAPTGPAAKLGQLGAAGLVPSRQMPLQLTTVCTGCANTRLPPRAPANLHDQPGVALGHQDVGKGLRAGGGGTACCHRMQAPKQGWVPCTAAGALHAMKHLVQHKRGSPKPRGLVVGPRTCWSTARMSASNLVVPTVTNTVPPPLLAPGAGIVALLRCCCAAI